MKNAPSWREINNGKKIKLQKEFENPNQRKLKILLKEQLKARPAWNAIKCDYFEKVTEIGMFTTSMLKFMQVFWSNSWYKKQPQRIDHKPVTATENKVDKVFKLLRLNKACQLDNTDTPLIQNFPIWSWEREKDHCLFLFFYIHSFIFLFFFTPIPTILQTRENLVELFSFSFSFFYTYFFICWFIVVF